jgi:hypothetical protein
MKHVPQFYLKFFIAFLIVAAFTACTTADKDKTIDEEKLIEKEIDPANIVGPLDTLFIESSTFDSAKGPTVFSFAFRGKDTLTLYGWNDKPGNGKKPIFNNDPDIKLLKGRASNLSYGPNVIFGNLVLTKKDIRDIKTVIGNKPSKYVLFAPEKDGQSIVYKIYVTNDDPMALAKMAPEPTEVKANPTPPKPWE